MSIKDFFKKRERPSTPVQEEPVTTTTHDATSPDPVQPKPRPQVVKPVRRATAPTKAPAKGASKGGRGGKR
jgi:hypothetical protein